MAKEAYPTEFHREADLLLAEIADASLILKHTEEDLAAELALLAKKSQTMSILAGIRDQNKDRLEDAKKALVALMKKHRADLFPERSEPGTDRVDLPHGALLHGLAEKVVKARAVTVELLRKKGWEEAIQKVESVNWDIIDGWPDARLVDIGTKRQKAEDFAWELKGQESGK